MIWNSDFRRGLGSQPASSLQMHCKFDRMSVRYKQFVVACIESSRMNVMSLRSYGHGHEQGAEEHVACFSHIDPDPIALADDSSQKRACRTTGDFSTNEHPAEGFGMIRRWQFPHGTRESGNLL